ncbi:MULTISPECIES: exodeoxyribonuclease V subunit beta [unclassified Vibrio]|uniref:RecBCD enzyme subunit RecB n=1 Tax=Vibrio sp. HB236076 TaxID=3232307 RepID=A0AB39HFD8_9VIBR|nr:exodeoxyribonuclease V subunit beta [Vibrio sp. HB161653]MDP5254906.1 exodeoxyribonuclease V subunit beta [Vibrio sp. HB161653]
MSTVNTLDMMRFPLHGTRLIEASAGTGKTFTITGLYIRLLLGHGDEGARHPMPLTVDQILVVTFTEAATAELRDRVRRRIHQARLAFERSHSDDPFLAQLLQEIPAHQQAAQWLLQAERQIDQAAIYTIHGFCQRMLVENAFESGSRFQNEFITDESQLKAQVVADHWRQSFYGLSVDLTAQVRQLWQSPSALLNDIDRYLTGADVELIAPMADLDLGQIHNDIIQRIDTVKAHWLQHQEALLKCIEESQVSKKTYSKKYLPLWMQKVRFWAEQATRDYGVPDELSRFSQAVLIEKTKPGENAPCHPVFEQIEDFLAQPLSLKAPLMAQAIRACRQRLAAAKNRDALMSFDDLLSQLAGAFCLEGGERLAQRIRSQYPVALIDEFQDTDPLQYSIFRQLYFDYAECGLFMIGDPKQAIYAFRGADIFTYIKARQDVSQHYTLTTNWRSSAQMINASNAMFKQSPAPFLYDDDIPFIEVNSSPKADQMHWSLAGQKQPAMTIWYDEDEQSPMSKSQYQQAMAKHTANEITRILQLASEGQAFCHRQEKARPIAAKDIAVLVRTAAEGRLVQQALSEQGVASVYLSNRDSVFSSDVAGELVLLLQAVLGCEDENAIRASLATHIFALDLNELDQLNRDELAWETVSQEFRRYRQIWQQTGVQPMIRRWMANRQVAERLLALPRGERVLTDIMHLSELLQQASQEIDSDHGLIRWLIQAIDNAQLGSGHDEAIQRLESERNLVQIITIHKSKGLEYDLVFLPFVFSFRSASEAKYYDQKQKMTFLDLTLSPSSLEWAEKERLAEELRLLYVAITRAVFGCYIGAAPLKQGRSSKAQTSAHQSAIGYLLQQGQEGDSQVLAQAIDQYCRQCGAQVERGIETIKPLSVVEPQQPILQARRLSHGVDRSWRMTSYSGLTRFANHHSGLDIPIDNPAFDVDSFDDRQEKEADQEAWNVFTFPKGSTPGTFLHSVFEQVDFSQAADSDVNQTVITQLLEQDNLEMAWLPVLTQWVERVLTTPLDGKNLSLNQLSAEQKKVEMEFLLPIEVLNAEQWHRISGHYDPLTARAEALGFESVQGMIKGFIDLVFEYQGRYYLLDWKSNFLGDRVEDYQGAQLEQSMIEHRYDMQYQIYSLALHRFLASRLPGYDINRHFGGVFYVFLRGVTGEPSQGVYYSRPAKEMILALDAKIRGEEFVDLLTQNGQMELGL